MAWNEMFNEFLRLDQDDAGAQIEALSRKFTFSRQARLRRFGLGTGTIRWATDPEAAEVAWEAGGEVARHRFADLPETAGVPIASFEAVVPCEAFAATPSTRKADDGLLGATRHWPSDDLEVAELARRVVGDRTAPREKADAVLEWLLPGENIRYGGDVVGSRYGVKAVLRKRVGRCWDFSDCFVTLCRAAGVPTRQVAGWWYGREGHIWAEVLIEGEGWMPFDPTAGMLCGSEHIPLMVTESGELPLVYASVVDIIPVKPEPNPALQRTRPPAAASGIVKLNLGGPVR